MSESESERVKVDTRCMNGKFSFLNLKFMKKKKNTKMPCFYLNYVEVGKRRSSVLGLLNDFLF